MSFLESEGRETGFRFVARGRSGEDRPDPLVRSLISRIESRVPRDDWKRWVLESPLPPLVVLSPVFSLSLFSPTSMALIIRATAFLALLSDASTVSRGRNRDRRTRREKETRAWREEEGVKGEGSVGRSDGRRFHFVSLPACGGAIAAALCQSVTLSRHPFYYLAGGCPPPPANPGPPFRHPLRATGTMWIKPGVA